MSDLIYLFARADEFKAMLGLLTLGLRTIGRFEGDLICYIDGADTKELHTRARVIDGHAWMQEAPIARASGWTTDPTLIWAWDRLAIMGLIPHPELYDTITLMDADILCLRDINPMLNRCAATKQILHQEETWQVYGKLNPGHHQQMYINAMSPAQVASIASKHPINAGVLTWPGSLHAELQHHWSVCARHAREGWAKDQATLNQVLRFQMQDRCAVYEDHDVGNASMTPEHHWPSYRLVHFAGFASRLDAMQRTFRS